MKKRLLRTLALASLMLTLGAGCTVRAVTPVPVAVRGPAVVVDHDAPRVRVRRHRRCYRTQCRTRCNIWGCWDRCRRVSYRCYY